MLFLLTAVCKEWVFVFVFWFSAAFSSTRFVRYPLTPQFSAHWILFIYGVFYTPFCGNRCVLKFQNITWGLCSRRVFGCVTGCWFGSSAWTYNSCKIPPGDIGTCTWSLNWHELKESTLLFRIIMYTRVLLCCRTSILQCKTSTHIKCASDPAVIGLINNLSTCCNEGTECTKQCFNDHLDLK